MLDIRRDVQVVAARVVEKHAPILVVRFAAQQVNCVKDREGKVVEGAEDDIRAVYYAFAMQRDYDVGSESISEATWRVVELAVIGSHEQI